MRHIHYKQTIPVAEPHVRMIEEVICVRYSYHLSMFMRNVHAGGLSTCQSTTARQVNNMTRSARTAASNASAAAAEPNYHG